VSAFAPNVTRWQRWAWDADILPASGQSRASRRRRIFHGFSVVTSSTYRRRARVTDWVTLRLRRTMNPPDNDPYAGTLVGSGPLFREAPADEPAGHYLIVVEGPEPGRIVELGEEPVTIGRDARQTMAFTADGQLSRLHARVSISDGTPIAEDLGSTNGTYLDGVRLHAPARLR
jgi:hypothetical protein